MTSDRHLTRTDARATRERTIAALSEHFARDRLSLEEFDRRLTLAHRTDDLGEIQALLQDLPALPDAVLAARTTSEVAPLPDADVRPSQTLLAIMAGVVRGGSWKLPRTLNVRAVMGGVQLDFRDARLPRGGVDVHITAVMGGVELIVPPHLPVEIEGNAVLGGFAQIDRAAPDLDPDAPRLRVHGLAVMGGVDVRTMLPGQDDRRMLPPRKG
jgi:hypothetical protein